MNEICERRRAECLARMQTDVVQLALELLVQQPDIEGFFGALTKTMVDEGECHCCAVWLIDESAQQCEFWMAYVNDRLLTSSKNGGRTAPAADAQKGDKFPCVAMATHLYGYQGGWKQTVEYLRDDDRLPQEIREFYGDMDWARTVATPLLLGDRTLGWMTVSSTGAPDA